MVIKKLQKRILTCEISHFSPCAKMQSLKVLGRWFGRNHFSKGFLPILLLLMLSELLILSSPALAVRATAGDEQVQISWIAPNQNEDGSVLTDLAGYNIYRSLAQNEKPEKINQEIISGCSFIDTGLTNGRIYYYTITAVDFSGNESRPSELVFATPSIMPPASFKALGGDGRIKLIWDKSENLDIRGYHLYRTMPPGEDYKKLTELPIEGTYFEDLSVENGINYYYVITSLGEDGLESPYSEEQAATPMAVIPTEPSSLKAVYEPGKPGEAGEPGEPGVVKLSWEPNHKDQRVIGYHVYRRNSITEKKFKKISDKVIEETFYQDSHIEENKQYLYSVVGVDEKGVESQFPLEVVCFTKILYIASISGDTDGKVKKSGDIITVIMRGEPGYNASFDIDGLTMNQVLKETDPGVYYGQFTVPAEANLKEAELIGYLTDAEGHKSSKRAAGKISIKNSIPATVANLTGEVNAFGCPQIKWSLSEVESLARFEVYRATTEESLPELPAESASQVKRETNSYVDKKAEAGAVYYYAVRTVDEAGNRSALSKAVKIDLGKETAGPRILSVKDDTLGLTVKTGRVILITVEADRGCDAFFNIEKIVQNNSLKEIRPGFYQGQYTVKETDKSEGAALIVKMVDQARNERLAEGDKPIRMNVESNDHEPPKIKSLEHNATRVVGISGKLVAGDLLTVRLFGEPGCVAFFSLGQAGEKIEMTENQFETGEYSGSYIIKPDDDGEQIQLCGYLTDLAGNTTNVTSDRLIDIDTRSTITVEVEKKELLANNESSTEVLIKVKDLNDNPLPGHRLALTLTTTDEYTDVIGGGDFGEETDGKFAVDFEGVTDDRGEAKALYTAGFAAKTGIMIAKDLNTGYVGVTYLTTYIESTIDLELQPKQVARDGVVYGPGDAAKVILTLDPEKITADGRSRARIKVQLLDQQNNPVSKGYKVTFTSSQEKEGRFDPSTIETNDKGVGFTYYQSGKNIGTIKITAVAKSITDQAPEADGYADLILMSDAPAKLIMTASSQVLTAGTNDSSTIKLEVTDINENPNPEATVQLQILDESGKQSNNGQLSRANLNTDRNGEASFTYTAGKQEGLVRIKGKVSSRIPTAKEIKRSEGTLFVTLWPEEGENFGSFWVEDLPTEEIGTISEWLKNERDEVLRGEPLARIKTEEHGDILIRAPYKGELTKIKLLGGEKVSIGQTIGFMEKEEE